MSEIKREPNPNQDENKLLVEKARKGDMSAFEQLILNHEKIVYNVALRMFNNIEDAKDIAQEVFIKAFRSIENFDGRSSFSTWIYRIAMNTCIDETRKRKGKASVSLEEEMSDEDGSWKQQYADDGDTPEESMLRQEGQHEIMRALERISPDHKLVIILRDIQGLSYDEIAEITDLTLGTVKSRISRARLQLKQELLEIRERNDRDSRQTQGKEGKIHEM